MKERPILFSTPMVKAILRGDKTQTRRVVKGEALKWLDDLKFTPKFTADTENNLCPYGQIGDVLLVRETWCLADYDMEHKPNEYLYAADFNGPVEWDWKPSIHMPRAACRIRLKITDIKVERLMDISEADAKSEGIEKVEGHGWRNYMYEWCEMCFLNPVQSFGSLWEKINGTESLEQNPWVWVITFEKI